MDELHRSDVEVHLVFLQDTLCAPSLKGELSGVALRVLSDLGTIRPQESLDTIRIILVRRNWHGFHDRIELYPGVSLLRNSLSAVVLERDLLGSCFENVLLVLRTDRLDIRLGTMIYSKTAYQSMSDLIISLYPHGTEVHRVVIRFGNHLETLVERYLFCEYLVE